MRGGGSSGTDKLGGGGGIKQGEGQVHYTVLLERRKYRDTMLLGRRKYRDTILLGRRKYRDTISVRQ
jgi:hypothetical protein